MDSWEWNKYAAAALSALVFVMAVHFAAETIFAVPPPAKPGYIPAPPQKTVIAEEPAKKGDDAKSADKTDKPDADAKDAAAKDDKPKKK
jgi:hypothetical protein